MITRHDRIESGNHGLRVLVSSRIFHLEFVLSSERVTCSSSCHFTDRCRLRNLQTEISGQKFQIDALKHKVKHMRRIQLYLDDDIARNLFALSQRNGRTVSELVRECLHEKFGKKAI